MEMSIGREFFSNKGQLLVTCNDMQIVAFPLRMFSLYAMVTSQWKSTMAAEDIFLRRRRATKRASRSNSDPRSKCPDRNVNYSDKNICYDGNLSPQRPREMPIKYTAVFSLHVAVNLPLKCPPESLSHLIQSAFLSFSLFP